MNKKEAKILIVDDIEDNRYTLERSLKRDGFENISLAECGKEALDLANKSKFDLILLDLMMPDISGLDVLKQLKGNPVQRNIPVIMVTASDEVDTAAECIKNGADDFVTKPFNRTLLRARVDASLDKKGMRDREEVYLDKVETDKKKSQQILKTVMPNSVVSELQTTGFVRPRRYDEVSILICDLVGFTSFCEKNQPELVIETLQNIIKLFENTFLEFKLEKIKTVGDAIEVIKKAKANKGKKKKINVSKYKKKANPNAPLTAAKQFTKATEAAAKKTEELEIEIEEALKEEE